MDPVQPSQAGADTMVSMAQAQPASSLEPVYWYGARMDVPVGGTSYSHPAPLLDRPAVFLVLNNTRRMELSAPNTIGSAAIVTLSHGAAVVKGDGPGSLHGAISFGGLSLCGKFSLPHTLSTHSLYGFAQVRFPDGGVCADLLGPPLSDDLPLVHDRDPGGDGENHLHVMLGEDDGNPGFLGD